MKNSCLYKRAIAFVLAANLLMGNLVQSGVVFANAEPETEPVAIIEQKTDLGDAVSQQQSQAVAEETILQENTHNQGAPDREIPEQGQNSVTEDAAETQANVNTESTGEQNEAENTAAEVEEAEKTEEVAAEETEQETEEEPADASEETEEESSGDESKDAKETEGLKYNEACYFALNTLLPVQLSGCGQMA